MIINISTGSELNVPPEMGVPKTHQMGGTWRENVCELGGRICYDSLGRGRSTDAWHIHLHEVEHYSVYEHATMTVLFTDRQFPFLHLLVNRPGVWFREEPEGYRVTLNVRTINDWQRHGQRFTQKDMLLNVQLFETLAWHWMAWAPRLVKPSIGCTPTCTLDSEVVVPEIEEEIHATAFMSGSRGFSHEQVRHRHRCAMSQRSTRYVDESKSEWDWHPLVRKFLDDLGGKIFTADQAQALRRKCDNAQSVCEEVYVEVVKHLEPYVQNATGCDDHTARKQARGAARGFLGNALNTEMIFTAPISQWRWMMFMRLSSFADAEIRGVFAKLLPGLQEAGYLTDLETKDSPDGLGICLA